MQACPPKAVRLTRAARAGSNRLAARIAVVRDVGPTREVFIGAGVAQLTA